MSFVRHLISPARKPRLTTALAALAVLAGTAAGFEPRPAAAIEPILKAIITDRSVPECTSASVLDTVRSKFAVADANVLHAGVAIGPVDHIVESYAGQDDPSPVARRYCEARAILSDGHATTLYYLVEQEAGFVGLTWNVNFCVAGYEPWHVHDGRCHAVRHRWW